MADPRINLESSPGDGSGVAGLIGGGGVQSGSEEGGAGRVDSAIVSRLSEVPSWSRTESSIRRRAQREAPQYAPPSSADRPVENDDSGRNRNHLCRHDEPVATAEADVPARRARGTGPDRRNARNTLTKRPEELAWDYQWDK